MDLKQTQQDDRIGQTIIGNALGVEVRVHDDGSGSSMYDLEFEYPDGRTVAAEVVSNRQEALQRTWNQTRYVGYQQRDDLSRVWTVSVNHGSNPVKLKDKVQALLANLEAQGLFEADELDLYDLYDDPEMEWPDVTWVKSRAPTENFAPGFEITMVGWSGWVGDGDDALSYVEEQLATNWPDVVNKLGNAGRDEAHAVVLLVDDVIGPKWAIEEDKTPTREPRLPKGIDGLWIVARHFPLRSVYFLPGLMWQEVTATAEEYLAVCAANPV